MARGETTRRPKKRDHSPARVKNTKQLGMVRAIALRLPETSEKSVHGTPGFYVGNKLFVWVLGDRASIAIWMDVQQRAAMVASKPNVFSVTPHYEKHPMVVLSFTKASRSLLEGAIAGSWRARATKRIAALDAPSSAATR
jgi:hypothetical protein